MVSVGRGPDGCPAVTLTHPTGFTAVVSLHGGAITRWARPPSAARAAVGEDNEILALRSEGEAAGPRPGGAAGALGGPLDGVSPLPGGVTLAFPQVGPAGGPASVSGGGSFPTTPSDGFLRHMHWSIYATGVADGGGGGGEGGDGAPAALSADPAPSVCLVARDTAASRAVWPHAFEAAYTVSLMLVDDWVPPSDAAGGVMGGPSPPGGAPTAVDAAEAARNAATAAWAAASAAAPPGGDDGSAAGISPAARAAAKPPGPPHPELAFPYGADPDLAADPEAAAAGVPSGRAPPPPAPPVQLRCVLQVVNPAAAPGDLTFTAGVLPHARLPLPAGAAVLGAAGRPTLDGAAGPPGTGPTLAVEGVDPVALGAGTPVDKVWIGEAARGRAAAPRTLSTAPDGPPPAPGSVFLQTGDWRHALELIPRAGFRDTGARCSGSAGAAPRPQERAPDPYAATSRSAGRAASQAASVADGSAWAAGLVGEVARAVVLPPGGLWTGEAVLRLHDRASAAPPGAAERGAAAASQPTLARPLSEDEQWRATPSDPDEPVGDGGAMGMDLGFVDGADGGPDPDAW